MTVPAVPPEPALRLARDEAVQRLSDAYASGHLTHDELDLLLGVVLTATSREAVATVVAALPAPDAAREIELAAMSGIITRKGIWQVPRRLRVSSEYGRVRLDLSQAVFDSPVVGVDCSCPTGGHGSSSPPTRSSSSTACVPTGNSRRTMLAADPGQADHWSALPATWSTDASRFATPVAARRPPGHDAATVASAPPHLATTVSSPGLRDDSGKSRRMVITGTTARFANL